MISVYKNPSELEKLAKEKYAVPQFLMMENAAKAMADFILDLSYKSQAQTSVMIVCGKGNNGGDGYALARLLQNKIDITILSLEAATATEAAAQVEMCIRLGINILSAEKSTDLALFEKICKKATPATFIVDCIYGTGFHGELNPSTAKIIEVMNQAKGTKIACDIPSAFAFRADYTITMGSQKLALYSDKAKACCGKIICTEIGLSTKAFEAAGSAPDAFLIENSDIKLPVRKNRASHKGTYGHTAVFCGDKAGAAIIAATAAMNFGSGLTSLIQTQESNLSQFKISPSLMISETLPAKTSCISLGSGFTDFPKTAAATLLEWFKSSKSPAAVLDAGILTSPELPALLKELNSFENARIVLTPHLSELSRMLENIAHAAADFPTAADFPLHTDFSVTALAENPEAKLAAGKLLNKTFPKTAVIMKSANTFIAAGGEIFIITDGAQSLSKGGSGDILAGLTASLLAQGYSAKDAAITAAEYHAFLSSQCGAESFSLTPEKLLNLIN